MDSSHVRYHCATEAGSIVTQRLLFTAKTEPIGKASYRHITLRSHLHHTIFVLGENQYEPTTFGLAVIITNLDLNVTYTFKLSINIICNP